MNKQLFLVFGMILVTGCDGGAFASYSNYDLKEAYYECKKGNLSAAGEQRCRNIRKECDNRKAETGFRC